MAADTRPFKSKEQDGHGNEVIVRDQQLVEQTSQTTMASGEYFEIVDVDGRMAKIPKDNMIGVVREALGTLLNGLADQTTVTKALTLNGDTLGASTAATLASVLGENIHEISSNSSEVLHIKRNAGTPSIGFASGNSICGYLSADANGNLGWSKDGVVMLSAGLGGTALYNNGTPAAKFERGAAGGNVAIQFKSSSGLFELGFHNPQNKLYVAKVNPETGALGPYTWLSEELTL